VQTIGREHHVFSYSVEHPPVAKIVPRESVLVETTYAFGDQPLGPGDTLADIHLALCDPLTGPLYVETAEPGDTLAVHIENVEPTDSGAQGVIPDCPDGHPGGIGGIEHP
jgi:amidase